MISEIKNGLLLESVLPKDDYLQFGMIGCVLISSSKYGSSDIWSDAAIVQHL